ncbi:hypothetical protein ACWPKO_16115 [Coraliomargarita sp. W4R53]
MNTGKSCPTGGCGGPGLCPGIALMIAYTSGIGITWLTGLTWLGWAVGIPLAIILLTGAWRFLPRNSKHQVQEHN